MAGKKISELPVVEEFHDGCCMPIVSFGETKKATYQTLVNQLRTDLGIDEKAPIEHTHTIDDITDFPEFVVETYSYDHTVKTSISIELQTQTISKPGYKLLAISGVWFNGTNFMHQKLFNFHLDLKNSAILYRFKNESTATFTGSINFQVLWMSN